VKDKKIADKWIEALRSWKYRQCKKRLYTPKSENGEGGYCCLGVLAKVVGFEDEDLEDHDLLTAKMMNRAGMETPCGRFVDQESMPKSLDTLNDHGTSFAEIADLIEKHWEQL